MVASALDLGWRGRKLGGFGGKKKGRGRAENPFSWQRRFCTDSLQSGWRVGCSTGGGDGDLFARLQQADAGCVQSLLLPASSFPL